MKEEQSNSQGNNNLNEIIKILEVLDDKIEKQNKRLEKLEAATNARKISSGSEIKKENIPLPPPPLPDSSIAFKEENKSIITNAQPDEIKEKIGLEENIGGKWFARIGIVALILGISFFLKYAFDNNWIGEAGRVAIGIIIGLAFVGAGEKFIRKYFNYCQIIIGGGIAILYLSIFAAFNFYHLIGQYPAFFLMALITVAGIFSSIRHYAKALFIVSILGGFLAPFLISTGENNQISLFSYILLLDLAILAISIFKKWHEANLLGFIGTGIIFLAWALEFYTKEFLGITMFFLTIFFIVYSVSALIYNLTKKEISSATEQVLTFFVALSYFWTSFGILNEDYHDLMGFFVLTLAIYYILGAYLVRILTYEDKKLYNFLSIISIGFITLAIPIQFDDNSISICWLVESLILFYLGIRLKKQGVIVSGLIVFILSIFRLLFVDSAYPQNALVIFNQVFLTFIFAIIISYVSVFLFKFILKKEEEVALSQTKQVVAILIIVANFLTIFSISREIGFYHKEQITFIEKKIISAETNTESRNYLSEQNNDKYYNEINKIKNRSSVSLSIFWLSYGIGLMIFGIIGKRKGMRIGGIILLSVAILKLFFYDLWNLGTLYRIISSIILGVVLLLISFAYQKYKDKIKEII